ncbi:SGNH/GDSL hydrolase family protein [Liquorilactobacillus satsumensis]|uniref:SGNH/GDSL hydrolase family protein n=2 Tax=Liquorilactobacillus satsumensis TaxID=259059 RepID=UPI001E3026FA|nr:GDSL-type esterase/lipase family protein [Liquorilactobacillus satsumensis]MCC7666065.1 hypothetical protein [Liquorilactobacillus satsumensis]MCP9312519.1 SGNH/GDSL hydrolase family protein [Liquorilactobacillus satsumensis]MCP9328822.1 SGNH/GDSL hydrolase family protein [Liquorilactobacillus satsumensis]MCP9356828.1 SGNH/GDSL hydrolase family protein [Liquorilactobacillus satsumensis]MCP9370768.1 SGNH/GDSL hydrolase family protein [Liquorilactobacillus satsumensis]
MKWVPIWQHNCNDFSTLPFRMEELTQIVQVTTNVSGIALRLHLTNLHGKSELVFQKLEFSFDETFHVKHEITLHGTATIKIPAGSRVITDPLKVAVHTGQRLFFRLSSSEPQNYLDFANTYDTTLTNAGMIRKADKLPRLRKSFTARRGWFCLEQIEFWTAAQPKTILFTGDSLIEMGLITDSLTALLNRAFPEKVVTLNSGISGNRLLHDAPTDELLYQTFGQGLLHRLPDLLEIQPELVFVLAGGNDLILPLLSLQAGKQKVTAPELLAGVTELQQLVSKSNGTLLLGDLLPFRLGHSNQVKLQTADYEDAQQTRREFNRLLTAKNYVFHNYFVADAQGQLSSTYDLGDHMHVSKAGGIKIAAKLYEKVVRKLELA